MAWVILLTSAVFEAVWATALGLSHGLTEPIPTIIFVLGAIVSMSGLGWALKSIPIGTAYAVWVGVGAALTVNYAMLSGMEEFTLPKVICIAGIIAAVIGLKLLPAKSAKPAKVRPAG